MSVLLPHIVISYKDNMVNFATSIGNAAGQGVNAISFMSRFALYERSNYIFIYSREYEVERARLIGIAEAQR